MNYNTNIFYQLRNINNFRLSKNWKPSLLIFKKSLYRRLEHKLILSTTYWLGFEAKKHYELNFKHYVPFETVVMDYDMKYRYYSSAMKP